MTGELFAGLGLGVFAGLIGLGGIVAALRRRSRRAEIAATYGSTGGIAYTIVQAGCSGLLMLGGVFLIVIVLITKH
jgi:hypothetical protein